MYDYKAMMVFAMVVELGSMQAAAEKLSMTPSAVTQTIQKLEKQLNVKLLHRTTRKLSLTEAGNVFYQHIAHINSSAENAVRSVEALRSEPIGVLNIVCATGLLDSVLVKSFKTILDKHPEFRLNIIFDDNPIDLAEQQIDIVLRSGDIADERAIARHLYDFEWSLIAHRSYLEEHNAPKTVQELEKLDWISHPKTHAKREPLLFQRNDETLTVNPYYRIHCNSVNAAKRLVMNGLGVAKIPTTYVREQLDSGELVELCPNWKLPSTPLYLVTLQRIQSEKVRLASELIFDYFRQIQ